MNCDKNWTINHYDLYDMLHANQYVIAHEDEVYFTHTDHLGSASWITNMHGEPIQYMHYAPYGELMANQQAQGYTYDERFKFTGKERDGESGYDYYGARYYTHLLGIWLSVDPLSDKYPHVTPYFFCNGNPIMLVDPDGRDCKVVVQGDKITIIANFYTNNESKKSLTNALKQWNDLNFTFMDRDNNKYEVEFKLTYSVVDGNPENESAIDQSGYSNSYVLVDEIKNSKSGAKVNGETYNNRRIRVLRTRSETETGAHEIGHALMNLKGEDSEHSDYGLMTKFASDEARSAVIDQRQINIIVESNSSLQKCLGCD